MNITQRMQGIAVCTAWEILKQLGVRRVLMNGIRPVSVGNVSGPVRTIRYLPAREDLGKNPRGQPNRALVDQLEPGDVLVVDTAGTLNAAVFGDMQAARASFRGAGGVIVDGVVRDVDGLAEMGLPVYARGTWPDPSKENLFPWETDTPIACGGVLVQKGDWLLADADGVVVIPQALVEQVAILAEEGALEDKFSQRLLAAGFPLSQAYPLSPAMRQHLKRFKADCTCPVPEE